MSPAALRISPNAPESDFAARLESGQSIANAIRAGLQEVIFGQDDIIEGVVTCLLADGHVLLEGAPGLGKTQIVRTLAALVDGSFSRIQFTPDLMPSDVLGTSLVVTDARGQRDFRYREGPIFANLVLADEINRATPKTQSALLEAMSERTVSVDGTSRPLPQPFFVLATENPIEMEGVFPLPEAQLDRFLMLLELSMPDLASLERIGARSAPPAVPSPITDPAELGTVHQTVRDIASAPHVLRYAARLVLASHALDGVRYGAGPRAVQALMSCGRARALLAGRPAVSISDIEGVARGVLSHRIMLGFEAEARGISAAQLVDQLLETVPVKE